MNHEKIVILPSSLPDQADEILNDLVYNQAYVLFVVLGNDALAKKLVEWASSLAGSRSDPGLVVWITDRNVNIETLRLIVEKNSRLLKRWKDISAFMLSIMDNVVDVLYSDDNPPANLLRVFKSFQHGIGDKS